VIEEYEHAFENVTGFKPYPYQVRVARELIAGRHVVVRAPTGAGKTWAVVAPFLCDTWPARPAKLIYALPLRTLAQGIYRQAREAARKCGRHVEPQIDTRGREIVPPYVTLQTGEQPDDPFFDRGTIIVTTYDQVLSGLLDGPYGLSDRLHNINAAFIQFSGTERRVELGPEFTQALEAGQQWTLPPRAHIAPLADFGPDATLEVLNSFTMSKPRRDRHRRFIDTVVPLGMVNTGPGFSEYRANR
jgi:hypothetical protein